MIHCIYHRDNDGKCSAAIVNKYYNTQPVNFIDINYGEELPWDNILEGDEVVIVDYSLIEEQWVKLLSTTTDVIWIDHHKTSINNDSYPHHLLGIRQNGIAAAQLTWYYFFKNIPTPDIVKYVSDFDIWKFEFTDTEYVNEGIYLQDTHPSSAFWEILLNTAQKEDAETTLNQIVLNGKTINKYNDIRSKHIISHQSYEVIFNGYPTLICNNRGTSAMFKSVKDKSKYDILCWWWYNGVEYQYRLSSEIVDCGDLCKQYGGGGHKNVGGFHLKYRLPELITA